MVDNGFLGPGLLTDTVGLAALALIGYLCGRRSRRPAAATARRRAAVQRARPGSADRRRAAPPRLERRDRTLGSRPQRCHIPDEARRDRTCGRRQRLAAAARKRRQTHRPHAESHDQPYARVRPDAAAVVAALGVFRVTNRRGLGPAQSPVARGAARCAVLDSFHEQSGASRWRFSASAAPTAATNPTGDERLGEIARLLEECIRDDDFVARYSPDEFVVLMPQTTLAGALAFGERLLLRAAVDPIVPGVGRRRRSHARRHGREAALARDSALYSARAAGGASLFVHTGSVVRRHGFEWGAAAPDLEPEAELASAGR